MSLSTLYSVEAFHFMLGVIGAAASPHSMVAAFLDPDDQKPNETSLEPVTKDMIHVTGAFYLLTCIACNSLRTSPVEVQASVGRGFVAFYGLLSLKDFWDRFVVGKKFGAARHGVAGVHLGMLANWSYVLSR